MLHRRTISWDAPPGSDQHSISGLGQEGSQKCVCQSPRKGFETYICAASTSSSTMDIWIRMMLSTDISSNHTPLIPSNSPSMGHVRFRRFTSSDTSSLTVSMSGAHRLKHRLINVSSFRAQSFSGGTMARFAPGRLIYEDHSFSCCYPSVYLSTRGGPRPSAVRGGKLDISENAAPSMVSGAKNAALFVS